MLTQIITAMYPFSYIIYAVIFGFFLGSIITHTFTKKQIGFIKVISLFILLFLIGLVSYLLLEDKEIPWWLGLLILGLSAEVLHIDLVQTVSIAKKAKEIKEIFIK